MKRLDELGVSPAPWKSSVGIDVCRPCLCDANGRFMLEYTDMENRDANACLLAASPDLYEALRLVLETVDALGFKPVVESDPLALAVKCGEKALEKAGGAE